ncbi:hypothetical protein Trydic_g17488 [Trypoxylus dichotomus]
MEELPEINMLKFSVVLFKFVGESRTFTARTLGCLRIFNVLTMAIAVWFAFANFFYIEGEMYVQALQSSMFFGHALLKYLSFLRYKPEIKELLNEIGNRFWNHRTCSGNVSREIERIHKAIERLQTLMLMVAGFGVVVYMLKPFLATNRGLLLESYIPRSNVIDAVLLFSQFYCFSVGVPFVLGYDFVYFAVCAHIALEFRLLKRKIRDVLSRYDDDTILRMSICIRHHQFLFTRTNFMNYTAKLFAILVFVGQFALYSFPAEQVTSEFASLSDAIYASLWYQNNVSNQKTLLFVMTAAQRVHYFSGAGLVNINVDAFESVSES